MRGEVRYSDYVKMNMQLAGCNDLRDRKAIGRLATAYLTAQRDSDAALADAVRQLLALPATLDPMTIIPIGYGAESPPPRSLRNLDDIVRYESY